MTKHFFGISIIVKVQEDEILKTKLKVRGKDNKLVDLRSFWEVWEEEGERFHNEVRTHKLGPHEAKWKLTKKYEYKLATTFMPPYAKSIYEYFGAQTVVDPCAGNVLVLLILFASMLMNMYTYRVG